MRSHVEMFLYSLQLHGQPDSECPEVTGNAPIRISGAGTLLMVGVLKDSLLIPVCAPPRAGSGAVSLGGGDPDRNKGGETGATAGGGLEAEPHIKPGGAEAPPHTPLVPTPMLSPKSHAQTLAETKQSCTLLQHQSSEMTLKRLH